jgi:hypothetical protein
MKIFNVSLRVTIQQIGEIVDHEPDTPVDAPKPELFSERANLDPLDKADKMLNKYLDRALGPRGPVGVIPIGLYPGEQDGQTITENIRIAAESFEDLQAILAKFHAVAKQLPAVPESLIRQAANFTPIG